MKKKIDSYIKEHTNEIIKDIMELVKISSYTKDLIGKRRALDYVLERATALGMETMKTSSGDVGIVEIGSGTEIVGVLTHVDIVHEGELDKWIYPPFEPVVSKGYLWGRGVEDNKGPVIMVLYALKAILELQIPLDKRIWLIIGTCGEGEWLDMINFKREFETPSFGFSPDGDFPVATKEKGYGEIELFFKEDVGKLEALDGGESINSIPYMLKLKLRDKEERKYYGVMGHSSTPMPNSNAIVQMIEEEIWLKNYNFGRFLLDFFRGEQLGEKFGLDSENVRMRPISERTTVTPTVLKKTEDGVYVYLNMRLWLDVTKKKVNEALAAFQKEYDYQYQIIEYLEPLIVDENESFVKLMSEVYSEYGFTPSYRVSMATSYAKALKHFVMWGPVFDTEQSFAHRENERVSVNNIVTATQIYATYLARTASPFWESHKRENMSSVDKALSLLQFFVRAPYTYDIPMLCGLTGMNRTTLYRDLSSLERAGLLGRNEETKMYYIGPMVQKLEEAFRALRDGVE